MSVHLKDEIEVLKHTINNLEQSLKQSEEELSDCETERDDLETERDQLEEELYELRAEISDSEGKEMIPYLTINDQLKADIIMEYWDKITLDHLDEMVNKL